ncbi:MAG: hypothetical protein V7752_13515 [Halopseudomonas sp.]
MHSLKAVFLKTEVALLLLVSFLAGQVHALPAVRMTPWRFGLDGQTVITWDRAQQISGGERESTQLQSRHTFNFLGDTRGFVWKPWFSRLNFGVHSTFDYITLDRKGSDGQFESTSWFNSTGANVGVTLLPGSRLQFDFSFSVDQYLNSDDGDAGRDYRFRLNQIYSPLERRSLKLSAHYELDLRRADQSTDDQWFEFRVDDVVGAHELGGMYEWRNFDSDQSSSSSHALTGKHDYRIAAYSLSTNNFASYILSDAGESSAEVLQLTNTTRWYPRRYAGRLDYSGTTRVVNTSSESSGGGSSEFNQLGHDSRLNYDITNELRSFGAVGLTVSEAGSESSTSTFETLGVDYSSPVAPFYSWDYRLDAETSVQASQSEDRQTQQWGASGAHDVRKAFEYSEYERASLKFAQSLSADIYRQSFDPQYQISHSAEYYRTLSFEEAFSSVQVTVADFRQIDGSDAENQLVRMELEHSRGLDNGASLTSDVGVQVFRDLDDLKQESIGSVVDGEVRYLLRPIFGVPRLGYESLIRADITKTFKEREGESRQVRYAWLASNELRWNWGLLSLSGLLEFVGDRNAINSRLRFEIRRRWRPLN